MELVYTDLMRLITPAANGDYTYIITLIIDVSRMEILFPTSKADAIESLRLYKMAITLKLGVRIQCPRAYKGGEYISKDFNKLSVNSGIPMEYTAASKPQQKGVSELDGRAVRPSSGA